MAGFDETSQSWLKAKLYLYAYNDNTDMSKNQDKFLKSNFEGYTWYSLYINLESTINEVCLTNKNSGRAFSYHDKYWINVDFVF